MSKRTIQQQLTKRHDCRHGLRGLKCLLVGDTTPYRILESEWGENCLLLRLVPAVQWDAYQAASDAESIRVGGRDTGMGIIIDFAALAQWQEPQGFGVIETTADKVSLSDPWPHVCC
jgi:hypothetical protein